MRGRTNAVLMLGMHGFGQGGILLAQSWLAASGNLDLVGFFGLAFTVATLAYVVVDWGGQTLLARHRLADQDDDRIGRIFWEFCGARVFIAIGALGVLGALNWLSGEPFSSAYLLAAAPAILLGAVNPTGLIDGMHRSGLNGVAAMLPYACSAVGLMFVADLPRDQQGLVLGAAFSLGTVASLVVQYAVLHGAHALPRWHAPSKAGMRDAARDGSHVLLTSLPPLVFLRVEISALMALLGPEQTGLFVYARQLLGVILQGAQFMRRAEFPTLIAAMTSTVSLRQGYARQSASIGIHLLGSIGFVVLGIAALEFVQSAYRTEIIVMAWAYAFILIPSALFGATLQIFLAINRAGPAALVTNVVTIAVGLLIYPAVMHFNFYGIALVDLALNVFCASVLIVVLRRDLRRTRAKAAG